MPPSTDHTLIRDSVARFADEVIAPARHALNHHPDEPLPERLIPGLAELGLFELDASDAAGMVSLSLVLETLAERAAAPAALLFAHHLARELIRAASPDNGSARWLTDKRLGFPAYAEPGVVDRAPRAWLSSGELRLDGTSRLVVGAPVADALLLPVTDTATTSVALVVVEPGDDGVRIGESLLTLGMRGCPSADVALERVQLPAERLLARQPLALDTIGRVSRRFHAPAVAIASGLLAQSLRTALEYTKQRYQGGRQIIDHDEVRMLLSGISEDHALCRLAVTRLAESELPEAESLSLFARAKQRAARATSDGVQLLGGNGYMEDYDQERCMRDARQAQCLLGRVDWARIELVGALRAQEARS
jgi:alkylation response protein AidB-like acyl-CoA dehydrogenase